MSAVSTHCWPLQLATAVVTVNLPTQPFRAFHLQPVEIGLPLQKHFMSMLKLVRFVTSKL